MSRTGKDLIVSVVAGAAIIAVFASFELVEGLFEVTREHEGWDLDEIIACIPALAIVATWFSVRRWHEVSQLNRTLNRQAGSESRSVVRPHASDARQTTSPREQAPGCRP